MSVDYAADWPDHAADWVAIRELTARYNAAFDGGDLEGWLGVFTPDGVLDQPLACLEGRQALVDYFTTTRHDTIHVTTDATVDVDGDAATQRCVLTCYVAVDGQPALYAIGEYDDTLVRGPEGWRFRRRSFARHRFPPPPPSTPSTGAQ